jgi:hypothetical protein
VLDARCHVAAAEDLFKRRQGLETQDVVGIHDERIVNVKLVDQFHAPEINFAQGI